MHACPYCAEPIRNAAILCRYCGKTVTPVPAPEPRRGSLGAMGVGLIVLLLVLVGIALLYAYRAQSPSATPISMSQATAEIQGGRVRSVTVTNDQATIELKDGTRQVTAFGAPSDTFEKVLNDYNATHDQSQQIAWSKRSDSQTIAVIGSILLSILPILLVGGLFFYMIRQMARR